MLVNFSKMHGIGNDFVVIDCITKPLSLTSQQIRTIADRRYGVGCDQLLLVERPVGDQAEFRYRIYNADGSESGQCGNGARCFARFVIDRGLTQSREITVETTSGLIILYDEGDQVRVDMARPDFRPEALPMHATGQQLVYDLDLGPDQGAVRYGAVSMGNPHMVIQVDTIDRAPVAELGPLLESHPHFPERVNVGFMQVISSSTIALRVFERGAGETLACGSGACAAVAIGHQWGMLDDVVKVVLPGGELVIKWQGEGHNLSMSGPAEQTFEGTIIL